MDVVGQGTMLASVMRREFFKLYAVLEYKEGKTKQYINHYRLNPAEDKAVVSRFEEKKGLESAVKIKAITGCADAPINCCEQEYVRQINKVGRAELQTGQITLAHMYFHPTKDIQKSIKNTITKASFTLITTGIKKGAPIGVLFHGFENQRLAGWIKRRNNKTNVYFSNQGSNIYHKKVGVFEPGLEKVPTVIIGSYNLGVKSRYDYEMCILIKNKQVADKVLNILKTDMQKCSQLTQEAADNLGKSRIKLLPGRVRTFFLHPVFNF